MEHRLVGGRYELIRPIGAGGSARVYLARDQLLDREVAVKVLAPESSADPAFAKRFRREARSAAALNHPNIVSIFDSGTDGLDDYLVMEYVAGADLKKVVQRRGPLPESESLNIGLQIASALEAAHRRGVVHRDVKPHNVLLDEDSQAKVVDFGIAHALGTTQLTVTNAVNGTAHYLSPEQARGKQTDARSDIYSLGIVLYELLTGRLPFDGGSLVDVALQHVQATPPPIGAIRPDLSAATQAVVMTALAKNPEQRFQSAGEMRAALEKALAHEGKRETAAIGNDPTIPQDAMETTAVSASQKVQRHRPVPDTTTSRHSRAWLAAIPPVLAALIGGAVITAHAFQTGAGRSPVGQSSQQAAASATHKPKRTTTPRPAAASNPARSSQPTSPPAAVPQSTSPPPPAPTATSQPAAGPASQPGSNNASAQQIAGGATSPQDAVAAFYLRIDAGDYAGAARLWSPAMIQTYSPVSYYIDQHFAGSQVTVTNDSLVGSSGNTATVAVGLIVTQGPNHASQELIGQWQVVRIGGSWFLNAPSFVQATKPGKRKGQTGSGTD